LVTGITPWSQNPLKHEKGWQFLRVHQTRAFLTMIHSVNIAVHVITATVALILGFVIIFTRKGSKSHSRLGRYFVILLSVVVITGFVGWLFFRSNAFLLMLTLLAGYNGYSGYRAIHLREHRSSKRDVVIAFTILSVGVLYMVWLNRSNATWNPSVVYPTLFGLILVTVYDLVKYFWLHSRIKTWWLYEHIYKILSAHSALFSAFCGTVFPDYKPYSQIGPSVLSIWLIIFFIFQQARKRYRIGKASQVTSPVSD
jgi:uncharacterized membrane protein